MSDSELIESLEQALEESRKLREELQVGQVSREARPRRQPGSPPAGPKGKS